jgi:RecB family exonuclease
VPRKPTLSPSKLTTYLACQTKYRWTYVDERGRWFLRSKSYFSFGATLHRVLQRYHDQTDTSVQTSAQAIIALEESWIAAGYASAEQMEQALEKAKAIVTGYVEAAEQRPREVLTLWVERMLRLDLGEFVLTGRIDRLDEWPDGTLEIVDYKSRRSGVTCEDVASDLAMACYQLLVTHHYPDRPVLATIHALRSGEQASWSMPKDELAAFGEDIRALGIEILNRDWEADVPTWKELCVECDFRPLCLKYPDFREEFEARAGSDSPM